MSIHIYMDKINKIQSYKFDKFISIGNRCIPAQTMTNSCLKQESLPFDWVQSNPQIILDCIQTNFFNYNNFGHDYISSSFDMNIRYNNLNLSTFPKQFINKYGMCFTHHVHNEPHVFLEMCKRRCDRFMQLLNSDCNILFIYMADTLLEPIELQEKQHEYLLKLENYLLTKFPNLHFKILAIHNLHKNDTTHVINLFHDMNNNKTECTIFSHDYNKSMTSLFNYLFKKYPKINKKKLFD